MKLEEIEKIIRATSESTRRYKVVYDDGSARIVRMKIYNNVPFLYKTNKKIWGNYLADMYYTTQHWVKVIPIKENTPLQQLRKNIKTALKYLNESGYWVDMKHTLEVLQTYDDGKLDNLIEMSYEEFEKTMREIVDADKRRHYIDFDLFWSFSHNKIKAINYPSWLKKEYIEGIENAISKNEKNYHRVWRKGYDNSFSLSRRKDGTYCAFYSEEYKNCGNGHYFIALDNLHAIHCEDD